VNCVSITVTSWPSSYQTEWVLKPAASDVKTCRMPALAADATARVQAAATVVAAVARVLRGVMKYS
jgi:hypothetical protein